MPLIIIFLSKQYLVTLRSVSKGKSCKEYPVPPSSCDFSFVRRSFRSPWNSCWALSTRCFTGWALQGKCLVRILHETSSATFTGMCFSVGKFAVQFLGSGSKAFFFFFFPQQKNTVPPFPVRYQILDIRYKNDAKDQRSLTKLIQR